MISPLVRFVRGGWLVAALIAMAPAVAWSQNTVRLFAGSRAEVAGANRPVSLGRPERVPLPGGVTATPPTGPVTSVCCQQAQGLSCTTDRDVGLLAPRQYVLSRYGASRSYGSGPDRLNYPGIQFSFVEGRVREICIVPVGR